MGELITISERNIKPRGAKKGSIPHREKLAEFLFVDELEALNSLRGVAIPSKPRLHVLYPGCGSDVLTLLLYLESAFPNLQEAVCTFIDIYDNLGLIKTILDEVGIPFSAKENEIMFYWGNLNVKLEFKIGNIFTLLPTLEPVDVYFERAFRIMKDEQKSYESMVVDKLNPGGILISDSGFQDAKVRRITVPQELSSYGEMVVGLKER